MPVRVGDVLRSLIFYAAFYVGSVFLVIGALVALIFSQKGLLRVSEWWSAYHRFCARWILGIKVVLQGSLPREGVLVALKHESFFEAIDLPHLLDRPAIFAKMDLLRIPLWGRVGAAYGLIGVERDQGAGALRKMIRAAREHQAQGRFLAIFPEGTRTRHGDEAPLQAGFAALYKLLGEPVLPIAVDSGPPYHRRWKRKGTITYRVGELIPAGLPRAEVEQRVTAAINDLNAR
ncbi:MAG: 1-acyl-sn-glycerol-3-phosphate acyltransferase [Sphingomonadaceae bacterium]|nr:1-acyl-sn-glycerol-3-phosphate acyltransferase [Sphingomonadaceae bacterium]